MVSSEMDLIYNSLIKKFENLTGEKYDARRWADLSKVRKNCTVVDLSEKELTKALNVEIRRWCNRNFGDNWIWDWDTFYFKNPEDAVLFALRWS